MNLEINSVGHPTMLSKDEEAIMVAQAEIRGQCGVPVPRMSLGVTLDLAVIGLGKRKVPVTEKSKTAYAQKVLSRVMRNEPALPGEADIARNKSSGGEIKVSGLSNNRAKQGDPRLSSIMYYRILRMYKEAYDIKEKYLSEPVRERMNFQTPL